MNLSKGTVYYLSPLFISFFFIFFGLTLIFPENIIPSKMNNSSLYLLSSLAQTQATIFGMVIGLNSIVMQLISTEYSSRMVNFFSRDTYHLWGLFGISIFYDLVLMILLPDNLGKNIYLLVLLSIFVAIYAYYELINFVYNKIIFAFNPRFLIAELCNESVEDLRVSESDNKNTNNKNIGMFDFIVGSLNKCDYNSYKEGLFKFYEHELSQDTISKNELDCIISDILRLGNISVAIKNDEAVSLIFDKIYQLFHNLKSKELMRVSFSDNIEQISAFIEYCARNRLEKATIYGIDSLFNIFSEIPSHFLKSTLMEDVLYSLSNIGRISSDMKLEASTMEAIGSIGMIISEYSDSTVCDSNVKDHEIKFIIEKLWIIGSVSVDNKLDSSLKKIIRLLEQIIINYSLNKDENIALFAIDVLNKIGHSCYQSGLILCSEKVLESYNNLEETYSLEQMIPNSSFESSVYQKIRRLKIEYENRFS